MALWGNNDAVGSNGTVTLNYSTGVVTGSGTTFGQVGAAKTGDVIKFGIKGTAASATYFGDAVIVAIAGTQSLTIGSTAGLSGAAIAATSFQVSECPVFATLDAHYSQRKEGSEFVYGVAAAGADAAQTTVHQLTHAGWVGVTTYTDTEGNLRVKSEVLVAMSGITAGNTPTFPPATEV